MLTKQGCKQHITTQVIADVSKLELYNVIPNFFLPYTISSKHKGTKVTKKMCKIKYIFKQKTLLSLWINNTGPV